MNLSFDGLNVSTRAAGKGKPKRLILRNLKGRMEQSQLTALMGGSGSGKTTLLSTLARRFEPSLSYQGSILYDHAEFDIQKHGRRSIAYVRQEDLVVEYLTVYEFLEYSGKLRLDLPLEEIHARIDAIIKQLRLEKCQNTLLGGVSARGVSGGERKRAAIGNELLTQPKVLLTDEPTSGLDSTLSLVVVDILKELAAGGLTVVTTIHSPSSAIFDRFDMLMVLDQGEVFFDGHAKNLVAFLESAFGLVVPAHFNPADFMMDVLILDSFSDLKQRVLAERTVQLLVVEDGNDQPPPPQQQQLSTSDDDDDDAGKVAVNIVIKEDEQEDTQDDHRRTYALSRVSQTVLLFHRMWKKARTVILSKEQVLAYAGLTLIAALLFFQMGFSGKDISPRIALSLWLCGTDMYLGIFATVGALHDDIPLVKKEVFDGSYSLSAYYMAKQLIPLPNQMFWSLVFNIIVLGCTSLAPSVGSAVLVILVLQLQVFLFQSVGLFLSSAVPSSTLMVVAIVTATYVFAFNGFFVPFSNMPSWYQWLRWPCLMTYPFQLVLQIVMPDWVEFSCPPGDTTSFCVGAAESGGVVGAKQVRDMVGVDLSVGACVGTMIISAVLLRVAALVLFKHKMRPARGLNAAAAAAASGDGKNKWCGGGGGGRFRAVTATKKDKVDDADTGVPPNGAAVIEV